MVAAPQYATFTFRGRQTGKTYAIDAYISDVANAAVRFSEVGGSSATSADHWDPPELVDLSDVIIVTGLTDTTKLQVVIAGRPTGDVLRYALQDDGLAFRTPLRIPVGARQEFKCLQLA